MLTSRGWWFLVVVVTLLVLAVLINLTALGYLTLTLLLWFVLEWTLFILRSRVLARNLSVRRELRDERGPVVNLWALRTFQVRVEVRLRSLLGLPFASFSDWLPFGTEYVSGRTQRDGPLKADEPLTIAYQVRCPHLGQVRFEGVQVRLADLQGFFFHQTFVRSVAVYRVLPVLVDEAGHAATGKRHNLLPPPGHHRLRRPGSGGELLNLRDYQPGDPPKTIAWKVTARRDRLITKEFESEVPLRCTLFVDSSHSVRLGPPGANALARLTDLAAAVAQANSAARDLTGLCLFDEQSARPIRPARTSRHLAQLLNVLADAAGLAPASGEASLQQLLPLAHTFAQEVYPDLLRPKVNRVPFWLAWLWPMPTIARRPRPWGQRLSRGVGTFFLTLVLLLLLALPFAGIGALVYFFLPSIIWEDLRDLVLGIPEFAVMCVARTLYVVLPMLSSWLVPVEWWDSHGDLVVDLAKLPVWAGIVWLALFLYSRVYRNLDLLLSPRRRRWVRWRKQMAALLSARYGLAPGGLACFLEDDRAFALALQRFLAEHQVPYTPPLYDADGRYLFASPGKVDVLARALLQAVARGRDNELYVLLVDLLELDGQLAPLLRAVKVALARHHQVAVICPWPPGVPAPAERRSSPVAPRPVIVESQPLAHGLPSLLRRSTTDRLHRAYHRARKTFARMGVPLVNALSGEPVALVLERMDRLRTLRRKR
jgi:uncharacterized protein (DUF58 family)